MSTEKKTSLGPWKLVLTDNSPHSERIGVQIVDRLGTQVASLGSTYDEESLLVRNAALMSSAPELLSALRDCMRALRGEVSAPSGSSALKQARAAIAKTEGVQS